jgi:pimeloyl-ACP methyl ester carboxylesterase
VRDHGVARLPRDSLVGSHPAAYGAGVDSGVLALRDGRELLWRASGPANAPSVLWLHGSTGTSRTMPTVAGVRVLGYDRPGFGGSSLHFGRDLRSDVDDCLELLRAQRHQRIAVLAFSAGAAVAFALAALAPDAVISIGALSGMTPPTGPPPLREAFQQAAASLQADPAPPPWPKLETRPPRATGPT